MVAEATSQTKIVRTLRNGQITIPATFRRELGIADESLLRVSVVDGKLQLEPVAEKSPNEWLKELYDYFAPARAEAIEKGYTEEEINGWIDEAIAAVRAEHRD